MNNLQTQLQLQTLVHTTFSCITYLRNIFTEECYETVYINNTPLKRIKNNQKTALFLLLLEKGIYDTINKKYLKSFTVGIYTDLYNPTTLVESYTFDIRYNIDENNFIPNIKKFCLVLQKLDPLPVTKYLTVKLVFTDDTPENYQPYGFKDGNGITYNYKTGENFKFDCQGLSGILPSEIYTYKHNHKLEHDILILKENYNLDNNINAKDTSLKNNNINNNDINNIKDNKIKDKNSKLKIKDKNYKINVKIDNDNNNCNKVYDNKNEDKNLNFKIKDTNVDNNCNNVKDDIIIDSNKVEVLEKIHKKDFFIEKNSDFITETSLQNKNNNLDNKIVQNNNRESIRCTCLIDADHFDMIYCDACTNWLHTVCCGYFSNNDKRIPKNRYKCAFCTNEMNDKLSELSIIRRLLAVLYNEKYQGKEALAIRMGINYGKLNKLFNRLLKEGFIQVQDKKKILRFEVIKNDATKSKLKKYFKIIKTSVPLKDIKSN